ncbi:MAG: M14 family metallopeptidase [candidate division KSB1 bacterium]|nr:M14 family metallopeptidase [candidate division KSB1 bacterium]
MGVSLRARISRLVVLPCLLLQVAPGRAGVPSPEEFFGFRVGSEGLLLDYDQLRSYFYVLSQSSPRIRLHEVGRTTEGRPFLVAVISSVANLARESYFRALQARLADARVTSQEQAERLCSEARGVVDINCSIHPTEVGASQMAAELAYELLSEESPRAELVRNEVIALLIPAHNPDGLELVADWYRKYVGTPYEGTLPPFLYHRYTGHDLNRDWFMLTQVETGLTVDSVYNAWRPHVVVDMHQMGSQGARLFVPPYVDPIDPNVDPVLQAAMTALGAHVALELTVQGYAGVITHSGFDAWTPARAYPNYHGGIRFLVETASCLLASSVQVTPQADSGRRGEGLSRSWNLPLPWPGGPWTLRHIVDYDKAVAWAVLEHVARNRVLWVRNAYTVAQNALRARDEVSAFVVPRDQPDPPAALQMLQTLRRGLVEIYEAQAPFTIGGCCYAAGTYVIPLAQPYGGYARTLLEPTVYRPPRVHPDGPPAEPYDVTAHQLPLLMGVRVEKVSGPLPAGLHLKPAALEPMGGVREQRKAFAYLLAPHTHSHAAANLVMRTGGHVFWASEPFTAAGLLWPEGTFVLENVEHWQTLDSLARQAGLELVPVDSPLRVQLRRIASPRIAVYESYVAAADEGWLRWVLEKEGFSYQSVHDVDIRAGDLARRFDVVLLPSLSERALREGLSADRYPRAFAGGLGQEGIEQLRHFVAHGGTLIALGTACELPLRHCALPVRNVLGGKEGQRFRCPGSLVRMRCDPHHPLCYGMQEEGAAFVTEKMAFDPSSCEAPITFATNGLLLSGWLEGEDLIANRAAVAACSMGKGRVVLFGFRPHFRAWTVGTFRVLFNALYWGSLREQ